MRKGPSPFPGRFLCHFLRHKEHNISKCKPAELLPCWHWKMHLGAFFSISFKYSSNARFRKPSSFAGTSSYKSCRRSHPSPPMPHTQPLQGSYPNPMSTRHGCCCQVPTQISPYSLSTRTSRGTRKHKAESQARPQGAFALFSSVTASRSEARATFLIHILLIPASVFVARYEESSLTSPTSDIAKTTVIWNKREVHVLHMQTSTSDLPNTK